MYSTTAFSQQASAALSLSRPTVPQFAYELYAGPLVRTPARRRLASFTVNDDGNRFANGVVSVNTLLTVKAGENGGGVLFDTSVPAPPRLHRPGQFVVFQTELTGNATLDASTRLYFGRYVEYQATGAEVAGIRAEATVTLTLANVSGIDTSTYINVFFGVPNTINTSLPNRRIQTAKVSSVDTGNNTITYALPNATGPVTTMPSVGFFIRLAYFQ
jgi:hypothetical protein